MFYAEKVILKELDNIKKQLNWQVVPSIRVNEKIQSSILLKTRTEFNVFKSLWKNDLFVVEFHKGFIEFSPIKTTANFSFASEYNGQTVKDMTKAIWRYRKLHHYFKDNCMKYNEQLIMESSLWIAIFFEGSYPARLKIVLNCLDKYLVVDWKQNQDILFIIYLWLKNFLCIIKK